MQALNDPMLEPTEENFRRFVDYLFQSRRDGIEGALHASIGMAGESGECLDLLKKSWVYDKQLDEAKLQEEMGDTIHYMMMLCIKMDWSFTDLIRNNIHKLQKRYPHGFSKADAIARRDVT